MKQNALLIRPASRSSLDFGGSLKSSLGGHEIELGLLYLASFLEEKGIKVSFLDMSLYDDSEKRLIDILKTNSFDFIGITSYTNSINTANYIAGIIKQYSEAKIVVGGVHASVLPVETLENYRNFDYAVYGEGEEPFTELIEGKDVSRINGLVWRSGPTITQNPPQNRIEDLDKLPFPARHLLDFDKYIPSIGNYYKLPSTGIISSRGCPFQCTYCSRSGNRLLNSVKIRSVENIIKEIKFCIENFKIYDYRFYDDVFVMPKKKLMKFCQELIDNKIKITWNCYSRVDTIDIEMLKLMRKTGCYHIKFGIEFGTQKWLYKTKKNTTLKQAKEAIKATKKVGIAAKASFMIGMPGETVEEIKETINFARELSPSYSIFSIFTPLPGSEIFNEAKKNKTLLSEDYSTYFNKTNTTTKLLKNQLDLDVQQKLVKEAYRAVYFNPRYFLHKIIHLIKNPSLYEIKTLLKGFIMVINMMKK